MHRLLPYLVLSCLCGFSPGCKRKHKPSGDEDLDIKAMVDQDRRLASQEEELLARRGNLQRERGTLQDKRAELISRKLSLPANDTTERAAIEKEESQLASQEESLLKQEIGVNQKLQSLIDAKTGVVDKLAAAGGKDVVVARREYGIAIREKDLARREADLARREQALGLREQALAERQAQGCPRVTTVVMPPPAAAPSSGGGAGRKEVEAVFRTATGMMNDKGILVADLPLGVDKLVTEIRQAVNKGEFARGKAAADQLLATVRAMKVDRTFIAAKIGRLNSAMRSSPPRGDGREKINALFQQATAAYGDGRFSVANKLLNRIYAVLH